MKDQKKTKEQLISELNDLRGQVAVLKQALAENQSAVAYLQVAPLGIYELDAKGRITFVNPSQEAITGYTADELLGTYVWDRIQPGPERDSLPAYLEHLVLEQPVPTPFFAKNIRKNGEVFDVRVDWSYKRNPQNQVTGFECILSDITERKRAEDALRESEERFKLFMDNSPAIAWMKDDQGRYVYANESCGKRVGVRHEDRIGRTDFELWPEETAEQFWKNDQNVLSSGQVVEVIEESVTPDGSRSYCRNFKFPFQDSTGRRFVGGVGIEITEQKQAEEALQKAHDELEQRVKERTAELAKVNESLRQSHDELQAIYNGMIEGLLITDVETKRFVRVNPSICRMLGYSEEELLAASIKDIHPPEEVPNDLQRFQAAAEGRVSINEDRPVLRKDGSIFYADITGHRVFYDERPCLLALFRDITERKQAQEALKKEYRNLKHLLHASDHERQLIAYEIHELIH